MKGKFVIVAPHADDEIIGCYNLLISGMVKEVIFGTEEAMKEAISSSEVYGFSADYIDNYDFLKYSKHQTQKVIYLFPDPIYEIHPEHRRIGILGEELLRQGHRVLFYCTNMLSPYIFEVSKPQQKRDALNKHYPLKQSLWAFDHKYYLFEGYTEWLMHFPNE